MVKLTLLSLLLFTAISSRSGRFENGFYTTCPTMEQTLHLSVAYVEVNDKEFLHFANSRPLIKCPIADCGKQKVSVSMMVQGENVFCALAENGPSEMQESAVKAAMEMKFKRHRAGSKTIDCWEALFQSLSS